jgi:hypothetical protein
MPAFPIPRLRFHVLQLPGIANALLSSMRRRRVFLIDWQIGADFLGPPPGGINSTAPWEPLLRAYGPQPRVAHWEDDRLGYEGPDPARDPPSAPKLWGAAGAPLAELDVEIFTHLNRGVFTPQYGIKPDAAEDVRWLLSVLPLAKDGSLLYGCVYRAALTPTPRMRAAAARSGALPPNRPEGEPAALVCMHLRSGYAGDPRELQTAKAADAVAWCVPVPAHDSTPPPRTYPAVNMLVLIQRSLTPHVAPVSAPLATRRSSRAFSCLDNVIERHGDAQTAVFVAVDDVRVRDIARARYEGIRPLHMASFRPQHVAWQRLRNASETDLVESYETTMADFYSLMQCALPMNLMGGVLGKEVGKRCLFSYVRGYRNYASCAGDHLVLPINTGFSRTAAIYGLDVTWWFENEHLVSTAGALQGRSLLALTLNPIYACTSS